METIKMKKLVTIVALLFTASAMAQPKFLEGAQVTVTLKNGKTYTYSSEEMAVVKRENLDINKLKVQGFNKIHKKIANKELIKNEKNRIYGIVSYGPSGELKNSKGGDTHTVKVKKNTSSGIGYMRKISEEVNVGIQAQTNGSIGVTFGTDF